MTEPRVPGSDAPSSALELTCGERVDVTDLHMGVREFDCECGGTHAVVQDVHPPSRFFPESLVGVLRETIEPEDDDVYDIRTSLQHDMELYGDVIESLREHIALANNLGDYATEEELREILETTEEHAHHIEHYLEDDTLVFEGAME